MSEIAAALIGAILAGLFQTVDRIIERKREAEAVLTAIASEVDSICRLIRHQRYKEFAQTLVDAIEAGNWDGSTIVIDLRQNYFAVFEGLVGKIGLIKPANAAQIVNFYAYCRSAIDSTYPDGVHALSDQLPEKAENLISLNSLLTAILSLGDEIVALPKKSSGATQSDRAIVRQ